MAQLDPNTKKNNSGEEENLENFGFGNSFNEEKNYYNQNISEEDRFIDQINKTEKEKSNMLYENPQIPMENLEYKYAPSNANQNHKQYNYNNFNNSSTFDVNNYNLYDYNDQSNYDLYYQSLYQMYPQMNDVFILFLINFFIFFIFSIIKKLKKKQPTHKL